MPYKALIDNEVVDVYDKLRFVRYQNENNSVVICSREAAQAILSSDASNIYNVVGIEPFSTQLQTVTLAEISDSEYKTLQEQLNLTNINSPDSLLNRVRNVEAGISEMNSKAFKTVWLGNDGTEHDTVKSYFKKMLSAPSLNLVVNLEGDYRLEIPMWTATDLYPVLSIMAEVVEQHEEVIKLLIEMGTDKESQHALNRLNAMRTIRTEIEKGKPD